MVVLIRDLSQVRSMMFLRSPLYCSPAAVCLLYIPSCFVVLVRLDVVSSCVFTSPCFMRRYADPIVGSVQCIVDVAHIFTEYVSCSMFTWIFVGTCFVLHVGIRRDATRQHGVTSRVICDHWHAAPGRLCRSHFFLLPAPPSPLARSSTIPTLLASSVYITQRTCRQLPLARWPRRRETSLSTRRALRITASTKANTRLP